MIFNERHLQKMSVISKVSLADLFAGRSQLLVQHFMLAPGWKEGCKSCSYMADHADGMTAHLAQRDVTFVAISRAHYSEIERFRRRMGWRFNWVSSNANSFNHDFRVSFTPEEIAKGRIDYNFGGSPHRGEELPGVSVFMKDEACAVFHTYSTYGRGVEVMSDASGVPRIVDHVHSASCTLVPKRLFCDGRSMRLGPASRNYDRVREVRVIDDEVC